MLGEYCGKQNNVYNLLISEIEKKQVSHAYLFDENNNPLALDIVMAFIKEILCSDIHDEDEINQLCKRIDEGNYPEVKVIRPDGMLIKKQQILDLQRDFSMMAVEGKKRIYVICDCEKMRPETANSMLKFLEEPDNDIIGILMTNNYNNLLSTIISRCQVIRLSNDDVKNVDSQFDDVALNFVKCIEKDGIKAIMRTQELLFDFIPSKNRDEMVSFFDKIIDMYYDIIKIIIGDEEIGYKKYYKDLEAISKKNDTNKITKKIMCLIEAKDSIKYNVNCNLLIDSLIVKLGGNIWA